MAKIILINPSFEPIYVYTKNSIEDVPNVPRAILVLGTWLQNNGHEVKLIDARIEHDYMNILKKELLTADFVGMGLMSTQIVCALKIASFVKRESNAKVIVGGIHPTLFAKQTLEDSFIDYLIHGEGEEALLELMDGKKVANIKNLAYKKNGKVIINERRSFFDMNKLPHINYDLLDIETYINRTLISERKKIRMLPVMGSRGCPHRCAFCIHIVCKDQKYRLQDVDLTIKEIKRLKSKYKIEGVKFAEDNFFVNRKRVIEMCERMIPLNIKWTAECRADYFRKGHIDKPVLELMKKSGCKAFTIGAESGSEAILDLIKKDITPKQIKIAAKICDKYGFVPSMSFITGFPGETKEDVLDTVKIIEQIIKYCPFLVGGINRYRPYPGNELYKQCFELANIPEPKTLRDWTKKRFIKLMSFTSEIPWNKNSDYMQNVAHYGFIYFMTNKRVEMYLKRSKIMGLGLLFFVVLTRIRWKFRFFGLPFDKHLYNLGLKVVSKLKIFSKI